MVKKFSTRILKSKNVANDISVFQSLDRNRFVGGDCPFPLNPYFIPRPPLKDDTRTKIYDLYLEDPNSWTPRNLAEKFGISIARVEAILRLKALDALNSSKDIPSQNDLSRGMERMLGAVDRFAENEPIREKTSYAMLPYMQFLDEESSFTPKDAAELLRQNPYENITKKLNRSSSQTYNPLKPPEDNSEIIKRDDECKGKVSFMIVDTSGSEPLQVREKDGTLRTATLKETWEHKYGKPKKVAM